MSYSIVTLTNSTPPPPHPLPCISFPYISLQAKLLSNLCPIFWFADVRLCHNKNTLTHFAEHKSSRAHLLKFCIHKILCLWNFPLLFTWDDQNLETKCSFTHIFLLVFLLVQWIVWNSFLSEQYLKKIPWGHGSLREHTFSLRELAPTHNVGKCRKISWNEYLHRSGVNTDARDNQERRSLCALSTVRHNF